ncbi:MAG: tryptophan halogenase family protein [Sulfuricaulis sp.]
MNSGRIEKIVIVGGGTAGWMSAAFLSKALPNVKITLVESSDIPTIGVGEATIATFTGFTSFLNMKESEWMPVCNGSYKYAIRFNDWYAKGQHYWHPFEALAYARSQLHLGQHWYRKFLSGPRTDRQSFYKDCFLSVGLCEENKILKSPASEGNVHTYTLAAGGTSVELRVPYAYHFDAGLFGEFLKIKIGKPNGVIQIIDDVTNVNRDEHGFIKSLDTKGGITLEGDLFVDCTGFRALLIDKTLGEPFDSYSDTLFVDRAIALRVPFNDVRMEMHPYTTTTALSAGWVWNIPVTKRVGTGYVYCSRFLEPGAAEAEFRRHVGEERTKGLETRHINISKVGKYRNTWVKNCVAIGLSSGFLEPLESTSLHFVFVGVAKLAEAILEGHFNNAVVASYNRFITQMMEEARDFIAIHYVLTTREDTPFWRAVKYDTKIPDSLADYLMKCKQAFPNGPANNILFKESSWMCILMGMNYLAGELAYMNIPRQELEAQLNVLKQLQTLRQKLSVGAMQHYDYLSQLGEVA